jgi:hypothetical protein
MPVSSERPRNERARRPGAVIQEASHVHDLDGVAGWCPLESSLSSKEIGRRARVRAYPSPSSPQGSYAKKSTKMRR